MRRKSPLNKRRAPRSHVKRVVSLVGLLHLSIVARALTVLAFAAFGAALTAPLTALTPKIAEARRSSQGVIHRIKSNETYEDLARFYYGQRGLATVLLLFNRRPEPLSPGTLILIPTSHSVRVKNGQSLADFARQNMNDPARADYLALLHGLSGRDAKMPPAGRSLKVVPSLRHLVRRGESLESIARYYYRDASARRLKLIALYNHLSTLKPPPGKAIRIPLDQSVFDLAQVNARRRGAVADAKPALAAEAPASARPAPQNASRRANNARAAARETRRAHARAKEQAKSLAAATPPQDRPNEPRRTAPSRRARENEDAPERASRTTSPPEAPRQTGVTDVEIQSTEDLYADGLYERAHNEATMLLKNRPAASPKDRLELFRVVGFSSVAMGKVEDAKNAFREMLHINPDYELDLYRTSPKILNVFHEVAVR